MSSRRLSTAITSSIGFCADGRQLANVSALSYFVLLLCLRADLPRCHLFLGLSPLGNVIRKCRRMFVCLPGKALLVRERECVATCGNGFLVGFGLDSLILTKVTFAILTGQSPQDRSRFKIIRSQKIRP